MTQDGPPTQPKFSSAEQRVRREDRAAAIRLH
jgi:hypothetical protein